MLWRNVLRCRGGRRSTLTRHGCRPPGSVFVPTSRCRSHRLFAALAVPLREYSEVSVRYFALQRLLLVCPMLARNSISAMPPHFDSEYDRHGHYLPAFRPPRTTLELLVAPPAPSLSLYSACNTHDYAYSACNTCWHAQAWVRRHTEAVRGVWHALRMPKATVRCWGFCWWWLIQRVVDEFIVRGWQPPVAFCLFLCCCSALWCALREGAEAEARIRYGSE